MSDSSNSTVAEHSPSALMIAKTYDVCTAMVYEYRTCAVDTASAAVRNVSVYYIEQRNVTLTYMGQILSASYGVIQNASYGLCTLGVHLMRLIESSPTVRRQEICNKTTGAVLTYCLAFLLLIVLLRRFIKWLSARMPFIYVAIQDRLPLIYAVLRHGGLPPPAVPPSDLTSKDADLSIAGVVSREVPPGVVTDGAPAGNPEETNPGAASEATMAAPGGPASVPTDVLPTGGAPAGVLAPTVTAAPTLHNGDAITEANRGASNTLVPRNTRTDVLGTTDRSPSNTDARYEGLASDAHPTGARFPSPPAPQRLANHEESLGQAVVTSPEPSNSSPANTDSTDDDTDEEPEVVGTLQPRLVQTRAMAVRMRINPLRDLMTNPARIKIIEGDVRYPINMIQRASNYRKQLIDVESGSRAQLAVKHGQSAEYLDCPLMVEPDAPPH